MFSPIAEGMRYETTDATRYTAKTKRSTRALSTRQVKTSPSTQKATPAATSANENG